MIIKIRTSKELDDLLDALAKEIVDAHIYHKLFCDLVDAIPEFDREFQQSNTFWSLTLGSFHEAQLIRLCRVFDQESNSLNLRNLLETIEANLHLFEEPHFRQRLQKNAFVDSLATCCRIPPDEELKRDIKYATCRNPVVKKLMIWRHNIVAHRGAKVSLGKDQILADNPLSWQEIEELLEQGLAIFNRYSSLYRATSWSPLAIGHDDFKSALNFIRRGLQKWDEDLEKERIEREARREGCT